MCDGVWKTYSNLFNTLTQVSSQIPPQHSHAFVGRSGSYEAKQRPPPLRKKMKLATQPPDGVSGTLQVIRP